MHPLLLAQLRSTNMATGAPAVPPAGHWEAVSERVVLPADILRSMVALAEVRPVVRLTNWPVD